MVSLCEIFMDGFCLYRTYVNGAEWLVLASETVLVAPDCSASGPDHLVSVVLAGKPELQYLLQPWPRRVN